MILITFGLTKLWIEKRHEFGHKALPKILQIDLIFCTLFIFGKHGRFFDFMRQYIRQWGAESIPQYREQVKRIKSKARAQERKYSEYRIENLERENQRLLSKLREIENETAVLRNLGYQVRNLKNVDWDKINKL